MSSSSVMSRDSLSTCQRPAQPGFDRVDRLTILRRKFVATQAFAVGKHDHLPAIGLKARPGSRLIAVHLRRAYGGERGFIVRREILNFGMIFDTTGRLRRTSSSARLRAIVAIHEIGDARSGLKSAARSQIFT